MAVLDKSYLADIFSIWVVDEDPTTTPVGDDYPEDPLAGDLIIYQPSLGNAAIMYTKTIDGANTGVQRLVNRHNTDATIDPTTSDDESLGYSFGSQWRNTSSDKLYVCVDTTTDTAVWKEYKMQDAGVKIWYAEDLTQTSQGNIYETKVTLSLSDIDAGDYLIDVGYDWRLSSTNYEFMSQVLLNENEIGSTHREEPKDSGSEQNIPVFKRFKTTLASGTHTVKLEFKSSSSNATAYMQNASISVTKLDIQ